MVHPKGVGCSFRAAVNRSIAWQTCRGLVEFSPRRTALARILNQIEIWFSQEAWVGVLGGRFARSRGVGQRRHTAT